MTTQLCETASYGSGECESPAVGKWYIGHDPIYMCEKHLTQHKLREDTTRVPNPDEYKKYSVGWHILRNRKFLARALDIYTGRVPHNHTSDHIHACGTCESVSDTVWDDEAEAWYNERWLRANYSLHWESIWRTEEL